MTRVQVKSIVLAFSDGTEHVLPIDDARKLYRQLDELFGDNASVIVNPSPVIIERDRWPWWYESQTPYDIPQTWNQPFPIVMCSSEDV